MSKDAVVTLKVLLQQTGNTKALRFSLDMSVAEVIKEIRVKNEIGGKDHGLLVPANPETGKKAYWLTKNRTLRYYGLTNNANVEFRKIHRPLKICLVDETRKTVVIDDSDVVRGICATIGEKIGLKSWEEFSLRRMPTTLGDGTVKPGTWLNDSQTLHDQDVKETDELVYAKRYFFSDDFVDKDDPFSLHLLYVTANKAVVSGQYPLTRNDVKDFAALQMQIMFGDHDPNKHKPGWIDVSQFFPPMYRKDKEHKLEKEVYQDHKKLAGTKDMNAKYRYVQLVRSLKSYGITYFDCQQKMKNKNKLQNVLIGVTRSKIMKVEPDTMKVVREWEWTQMRRWSANKNNFVLDFGDYEDGYVNVLCEDAEGLSSLIAGYIELILRTKVDPSRTVDDSDDDVAEVEQMDPNFGLSNQGTITSYTAPYGQGAGQGNMGDGYQRAYPHGWPKASGVDVQDLNSAARATKFLANELGVMKGNWGKPQGMSEEEWAKQFQRHKGNVAKGVQDLLGQARLGVDAINRNALDNKAKELVMEMMSMATAARNLAAYNSEQAPLLDGAKAVADSLAALMGLLGNVMDHPEDYKFNLEDALQAAEKLFMSAELLMNLKLSDSGIDKGAELLLAEIIRQIDLNLEDLTMKIKKGADKLPEEKQKELLQAVNKLEAIKGFAMTQLRHLAPVAGDPEAANHIVAAGQSLNNVSNSLVGRATSLGVPNSPDLQDAVWRLNRALEALLLAPFLVEKQGKTGDVDLHGPVQQLISDLAKVRANIDNAPAAVDAVKAAANDQNEIITATQALSVNADEETKERLTRAATTLTNSIKSLMDATRELNKTPDDPATKEAVLRVVGDLEKQALALLSDAGAVNALNNLRYAAKLAAAAVLKMTTTSAMISHDVNDKQAKDALLKDVKISNDLLKDFLLKIQAACGDPRNFIKQNDLLETGLFQLSSYAELVSSGKKAAQAVPDLNKKQDLDMTATETSNALHLLAKAVANVSSLSGDATLEQALGEFDVIRADLEAAEWLALAGKLQPVPGTTREAAMSMMTLGLQELETALQQIQREAKAGYTSALGGPIKEAASAFQQVSTASRPLAVGISADRHLQKELLATARTLLDTTVDAIAIHRALSMDKDNDKKQKAASTTYKHFQTDLSQLRETSKGLATRDMAAAIAKIEAARSRIGGSKVPKATATTSADAALAADSLLLALEQLVVATKRNPDAVGYAAQVVAGASTNFLDAHASLIASGANNQDQIKEIASQTIDELNAAKAASDNAEKLPTLESKHKTTVASIQALRQNAAKNAAAEQAAADIMATLAKAERGELQVLPGTASDILGELLAEGAALQRAIAAVAAALRDAQALTLSSPEAANAAKALIGTSQAAAASHGSGNLTSLDAARIVKAAEILATHPDNATAVHTARQATQAAGNLVSEAKARARAEPDSKRRGQIVKAAQALIAAATKLAHTASTPESQRGARDLENASRTLRDKALDLEEAIRTGRKDTDVVAAPLAKKIEATSRNLALAAVETLRHAANGREDQVKTSRNQLEKQVAELTELAGTLNPAVDATEKAINEVRKAAITLAAALQDSQDGKLAPAQGSATATQLSSTTAARLQTLSPAVAGLPAAVDAGGDNVVNQVNTLRNEAVPLAAEARNLGAATSDEGRRNQLLGLSKALLDSLVDSLKSVQAANVNEPGADTRVKQSVASAQAAINLLRQQLEAGESSLAEMEKLSEKIKNSLNQLDSNSYSNSPYNKNLNDLNEALRQAVAKATALLGVDKTNATKTNKAAQELTDALIPLVSAANACAATTSEPSAKKEILDATRDLGEAGANMVGDSKKMAEGKSDGPELLKHYNDLNTAAAQLLAATKKGALGDLMVERALDQLTKANVKVGTAAMYSDAGQLTPSAEAQSESMSALTDKVGSDSKNLAQAADKVADASKKGDSELGDAATALAKEAEKTANSVINAASRINSKQDQQNVLKAAKDLTQASQALVKAARQAQRAPNDEKAAQEVKKQQAAVQDAARRLQNNVQNSSANLTAHEKSIDTQKQQVLALLKDQPVEKGATPDDVVKAGREVIQSAADMYFAEKPEDAVAASQKAFVGTSGLVGAVNALKVNAPDAASAQAIDDSLNNVVKEVASMLETGKKNHDDEATKKALENHSEKVTGAMNDLIYSLKRLPNTENLALEDRITTDLDALAEQELLKCAQIIADAAKTLLAAKPKRTVKKVPGVIDQEDINEAILDAATAIATATGHLVQAATVAQQERVKLVKETPGGKKYQADPTWANGLISAAQNVAGSVTQLVKAANESVAGKAQEEALVASARAVATATAHLVAASRAKSDPDSRAQLNLKKAAAAVSQATAQLVSAANAAAQFQQEEVVEEVVDFGTAGGKAKELEQQMLILRLEKELERARQGLNNMRKARYAKK